MFNTFFGQAAWNTLTHIHIRTHTLVITWPLGTLTASQKPLQQRTTWQPINHLRERERGREEERHRWKGEATQANKEDEKKGERKGNVRGERERERGRWRLAHYTSPTVQAAWKNVFKCKCVCVCVFLLSVSLQSKAKTLAMLLFACDVFCGPCFCVCHFYESSVMKDEFGQRGSYGRISPEQTRD